MATFNENYFLKSQNNTEQNIRSKVYINPNFNRVCNLVPNIMHINPRFSHQPRLETSIKNKIYVNPKFVNITKTSPNNSYNEPTLANHVYSENDDTGNTTYFDSSSGDQHYNNQPVSLKYAYNSKYSFVRKKGNQVPDKNISEKISTTININKYKSVRITDIKKKLDNIKYPEIQTENTLIMPKKLYSLAPKYNSNPSNVHDKFKLVRIFDANSLRSNNGQISINSPKPNFTSKIKLSKGKYKKNNIPCPLFRKYGKCLRNIKGNCQFLHDQKNVNLCRKFLKGICHDNCLLSHDLTNKKMPTCNFYLRGICTKLDCPYLHVKLNEKAKICTDFMKGYCDKGDQCLKRHENNCQNVTKEMSSKSSLIYSSNASISNNKTMKCKKIVNIKKSSKHNNTVKEVENNSTNVQNPENKVRYYKESVCDNNDKMELLKPTRCKLGTLPSFIQL